MKVEFDTNNPKDVDLVGRLFGRAPLVEVPVETVKPAPAPTPAAPQPAPAAATASTATAPVAQPAAAAPIGGVDLAAAKAATTAYLQKQGGRSPATAAAIYNRYGAANLRVATPEQLTQIVAALNNE